MPYIIRNFLTQCNLVVLYAVRICSFNLAKIITLPNGTKPLAEPIIIYRQLDNLENTLHLNWIHSKFTILYSRKCISPSGKSKVIFRLCSVSSALNNQLSLMLLMRAVVGFKCKICFPRQSWSNVICLIINWSMCIKIIVFVFVTCSQNDNS